jgi:hypothetical protein
MTQRSDWYRESRDVWNDCNRGAARLLRPGVCPLAPAAARPGLRPPARPVHRGHRRLHLEAAAPRPRARQGRGGPRHARAPGPPDVGGMRWRRGGTCSSCGRVAATSRRSSGWPASWWLGATSCACSPSPACAQTCLPPARPTAGSPTPAPPGPRPRTRSGPRLRRQDPDRHLRRPPRPCHVRARASLRPGHHDRAPAGRSRGACDAAGSGSAVILMVTG